VWAASGQHEGHCLAQALSLETFIPKAQAAPSLLCTENEVAAGVSGLARGGRREWTWRSEMCPVPSAVSPPSICRLSLYKLWCALGNPTVSSQAKIIFKNQNIG
jgi:hypothetical protein